MTTQSSLAPLSLLHSVFRSPRAGWLFLLSFLTAVVNAQIDINVPHVYDAFTPSALASDATGPYTLSGFDNINPYNGHLNFSLPLLTVSGRGEAAYVIRLSLQRKWNVKHVYLEDGDEDPNTWDYAEAADDDWWDQGAYSPGTMIGRVAIHGVQTCSGVAYYLRRVTRLTFLASDGSEYSFRDQLSDGQPKWAGCSDLGYSRGSEFRTVDGTAATFVADQPVSDPNYPVYYTYLSGNLLFRNGILYRISGGWSVIFVTATGTRSHSTLMMA